MKTLKFILVFVSTLTLATQALAQTKPRALASVLEQRNDTFDFTYDPTEKTITFKDKQGSTIGVYKSNFGLDLDTELGVAVVKKNGIEFLVTSWFNGAATFNIRVFVPVAQKNQFAGPTGVTPLCDLGLTGDTTNFQVPDEKIKLEKVSGKTWVKVLARNSGNDRYMHCFPPSKKK